MILPKSLKSYIAIFRGDVSPALIVLSVALGFVLDIFAAVPIVGLTDFARCSIAGSLVVGPLLGLVAGLLLARSVGGFRRAWLTLEENSEAFKKWHDNRWGILLDRLLVGKRTQDVRAALERKPKYIRIPVRPLVNPGRTHAFPC